MLVSEGFKYALTCADTATGLLQAFTYKQTTGKATVNALAQLRGVCEHTKEWTVKRTHFTDTNLQNWVEDCYIKCHFHLPYNLIIWKKGCIAKIAIQEFE